MTDNVEELAEPAGAIERMSARYLEFRYKDPVQRAAIAHVHGDLSFMEERISALLASPVQVQRQTMRELDRRIEIRQPGNRSPAVAGLMTSVGTAVTLFGALYLALFNGWFGILITLTDPATGLVRGVTPAQSNQVVGGITPGLICVGLALLGAGLLAYLAARSRDNERATLLVWKDAYSTALAEHADPTRGHVA